MSFRSAAALPQSKTYHSKTYSESKVVCMAENKKPEFTVTDRRLFTPEGELRLEAEQEEAREPSSETRSEQTPNLTEPASGSTEETPPAPSAKEQKVQSDAYRQSTCDLDEKLKQELGSRQAAD